MKSISLIDAVDALSRAVSASASMSKVVKFRLAAGYASTDSTRTIQMRWADRVGVDTRSSYSAWTLPDGSQIGIESAMRWEDLVVSDIALRLEEADYSTHAGPFGRYSIDADNEFLARVTITNPMDPDTYDWRDLRWIGAVEKP